MIDAPRRTVIARRYGFIVLDCGHVLAKLRRNYTCDACLVDANETLRQHGMERGERPETIDGKIEWFRSKRGANTLHAHIDGVWLCSYASRALDVEPAKLSDAGNPMGRLCGSCLSEIR